ncbi:MAG: hypothetical protein EOP08_11880, partial [Proteobacteria bacterium]
MRFHTSLTALLAFSSLAACAGDGCGGCAGIERIPGGYPRDKAIEGAGAIRVTRPGLDLIAAEAPKLAGNFLGAADGNLTFDLPKTTLPEKAAGFEITICNDGPGGDPARCRATVNLGQAVLHVDAVTPNKVRLSGTLPLTLSETRTKLDGFVNIYAQLAYGANPSCDRGTPKVTPYALPVAVDIPVLAETTAPRNGYTKLDLENAVIDMSGISEDQVAICVDCGILSGACNG